MRSCGGALPVKTPQRDKLPDRDVLSNTLSQVATRRSQHLEVTRFNSLGWVVPVRAHAVRRTAFLLLVIVQHCANRMTQPIEQLTEFNAVSGLHLGAVIGGKYRIDDVLGSGGMGVVLSATHLELDAAVAIKVVRAELANNEEVVARMLFEARAAAKLHSAHIVRVLDVGRLSSGAPYIVMERLEGSDLASQLSAGCFTVQESVDYVLQACEGLAEAHSIGIIHRDLKPENLFVAETPEGPVLKILDFGISKDVSNFASSGPRRALTNAGYAVGSPYYMSPEQMRASLELDARADIWSLGAILFELLTGRCPFEGESLAVVSAKVLGEEAPSLHSLAENVPAPLAGIVARCLMKDAGQRFEDVGKLAAALRDFASAEGQLCADRSARLASGINLKSDRAPRITPATQLDPGSACSSPTLQSLTRTPLAGPRLALASVAEGVVVQQARVVRPLPRAAFAAFAGFILLAAAGTFWSFHSRTAAASVERGPRPQVTVQPLVFAAQPAPTVAIASVSSLPLEQAPPPKPRSKKAPAAVWARQVKAPLPVATRTAALQPSGLASATADAPAAIPKNVATASSTAWDSDRLGGRY